MNYDIHNPTRATRIFHDGLSSVGQLVRIAPGQTICNLALADRIADDLRSRTGDLVLVRSVNGVHVEAKPLPPPPPASVAPQAPIVKPPILITGMMGLGDNLRQRAIVRELMKTRQVWLWTCHYYLYQDLAEQGLKVMLRTTSLRAQAKTIIRERHLFCKEKAPAGLGIESKRFWYTAQDILGKQGTVLGSMFNQARVPMPEYPDFSIPIRPEWSELARKLIATWNTGGKPILLYRPVVIRQEWNATGRNPDTTAYAALFAPLREKFFVVSIADLAPGHEWIAGVEQSADVKLHKGELDFRAMCGLFGEASLVFTNPGFMSIMAQATRTPVIVVYGGREDYHIHDSPGAHLAPTLGIDPDKPCNCFRNDHNCNKQITLPPAHARIEYFVKEHVKKKRVFQVRGLWGIGDCIHQRAVLRELLKRGEEVWLDRCHYSLSFDLIRDGMKVMAWDSWLTADRPFPARLAPSWSIKKKIDYPQHMVDKYGSILGAMFGEFDLKMDKPDFRLPVPDLWREAARKLIASWRIEKPLMIYRPNTVRQEFAASMSRSADPTAYDALYQSIRSRFFVVSIAKLGEARYRERILGMEQPANIKLHRGQLDFPTMVGLYAEAALSFSPSCFAPVLAQAVGTPSVIIYGGKECHRTAHSVGDHLAPTLGIDPDEPCGFHYLGNHNCKKKISLVPAIAKIEAFIKEYVRG